MCLFLLLRASIGPVQHRGAKFILDDLVARYLVIFNFRVVTGLVIRNIIKQIE